MWMMLWLEHPTSSRCMHPLWSAVWWRPDFGHRVNIWSSAGIQMQKSQWYIHINKWRACQPVISQLRISFPSSGIVWIRFHTFEIATLGPIWHACVATTWPRGESCDVQLSIACHQLLQPWCNPSSITLLNCWRFVHFTTSIYLPNSFGKWIKNLWETHVLTRAWWGSRFLSDIAYGFHTRWTFLEIEEPLIPQFLNGIEFLLKSWSINSARFCCWKFNSNVIPSNVLHVQLIWKLIHYVECKFTLLKQWTVELPDNVTIIYLTLHTDNFIRLGNCLTYFKGIWTISPGQYPRAISPDNPPGDIVRGPDNIPWTILPSGVWTHALSTCSISSTIVNKN